MKDIIVILFILPLFCSAQTTKVTTSTALAAPVVYTQSGVDTLVNRLTRRVAALEAANTSQAATIQTLLALYNALPALPKSTVDSLRLINPLVSSLQTADANTKVRIDSLVRADSIANAAFTLMIMAVQDRATITEADVKVLKAWADEKQKIFNQLFK